MKVLHGGRSVHDDSSRVVGGAGERSEPLPATAANGRTRATAGSRPTAIVYCEGQFGAIDGKTANGLVRHSDKYRVLSVIDSHKAGLDTGVILGGRPNAIPVCRDLADAVGQGGVAPDYLILGMAPATGMLSPRERVVVLEAIEHGLSIVSGLHEFLSDDPELVALSAANNVELIDVRKPRAKTDLRMFTGRIAEVTCPRIAVLGTDCAIGKRTTATVLTRALCDRGLHAVMVCTGQTGMIQGARYGVALDAIPSQFCAGELERTIVEAFEAEAPDVIVIEGQGALSHPAFSTSSFVLRGSCPDAVILQHAPGRRHRCDFEHMAMPSPGSEIALIEAFCDTRVIGLTLNHEHMTPTQVDIAIDAYEADLGIPTTDALTRSPDRLVEMVSYAFPELGRRVTPT